MDFPHYQLQAGLAATMFSPDVVPALWGQSEDSKQEEVEVSEDLGQLQALSPEQFTAFAEEFVTSTEDEIDTLHNDHSVTEETSERNDTLPTRGCVRKHQRFESLHVNFSHDEVRRIAQEIYDETVAEVNLSLFSYWVNESSKNYEEASLHIRELRLDRGYNLARIANPHLRALMQEVFTQRPVEARIALQERASRSNLSVTTISMRSGSKGDFSVFPRIDALPPILRVERQRAMTQAAQRSTSLASMAPELRVYPPDTPDRPLPLTLRSPTTTSSTLSTQPTLPLGFPSPGTPVRISDGVYSGLTSYAGSLCNDDGDNDGVEEEEEEEEEEEVDQEALWHERVADVVESVMVLEKPDQINKVIEELEGLKAMYL
ncbi:hypothetical protein COCMIDRAFT_40665 [Bipolaris oryzae ATCC 44560]|uniref:Uncharacterized protein n=1 Tax=Bipolaris oryzae ATCC 44560 TaxID=930090 RepID=W6YP01_COCMI|nr:uncharacterized protein COCMIDRAFT_40665 [Bipolaris oryzae ATCC 44560]EUC41117.1 hypothetical protein COCMIDRAFT_40665 [Bipolaris oryzae ATCC 44560]